VLASLSLSLPFHSISGIRYEGDVLSRFRLVLVIGLVLGFVPLPIGPEEPEQFLVTPSDKLPGDSSA